VAVIGAGRVATALAVAWARAGYLIVAVSGRDSTRERVARFLPEATFQSLDSIQGMTSEVGLVVLGLPDDLIADVCERLAQDRAFAPGQRVLHLSGSVGLEALRTAREAGAEILSLHPLQSFPTVEEGIPRLAGSPIAVTGFDENAFLFGETLARDAGGRPFRLADEVKPLYHAAAVFCSNYLVAVEGMAERLFRLAGIIEPLEVFEPLARAAFESTFSLGAESALTGPAARGDAGTIARNLAALHERAPDAIPAYVALARVAVGMAAGTGRLGADGKARVEEELRRWT
jgi:predicted short-subunit dehydrogenase-like oxidoreductase (DUF2520 family)